MIHTRVYAFYGYQLHSEWAYTPSRNEVPAESLLYYPSDPFAGWHWYNMDLSYVLPEEVPKQLRALVLLMGI